MTRGLVAAGAIAALALTGCGSYAAAHDHNLPTPAREFRGVPVRIDTPGNFPSVVLVCREGDGVYVAQDTGSSPFVVRADPACR